MTRIPLFLAAAGFAALIAAPAMADLSAGDKAFLTKAAQGGLAEVQLGKLAQENAGSPQVKQFGERMVTDHSKANQELMQIAQKNNLTLPSQPAPAHAAMAQKLHSSKGAAFDAAYMQDMVSDHREDVADFRRAAQTAQDPVVKAFAQKYLPALEQHLSMAESAAGKK